MNYLTFTLVQAMVLVRFHLHAFLMIGLAVGFCFSSSYAATTAFQEALPASIMLRALDVEGSTIPHELEQTAHHYIGRKIDTKQLQQLAADLDEVYARSDIAIYTIALRDMDSSGHLKVTVREGFLQRLRFTGLVDGIGARVAELGGKLINGVAVCVPG